MNETGAIVLGAVLALGTSLVLELVKTWMARRRAAALFLTLLKMDLPMIRNAIERLVETQRQGAGFFHLLILNEIQSLRQGFDRNRDRVAILHDHRLRQDLIDFYRSLAAVCQETISLENFAPNAPPNAAAQIVVRRLQLSQAFTEIVGRARTLEQRIAAP